jgi:hypothetical protein
MGRRWYADFSTENRRKEAIFVYLMDRPMRG